MYLLIFFTGLAAVLGSDLKTGGSFRIKNGGQRGGEIEDEEDGHVEANLVQVRAQEHRAEVNHHPPVQQQSMVPQGMTEIQNEFWEQSLAGLSVLRESDLKEKDCCTPTLDDSPSIVYAMQPDGTILEFHVDKRRLLKTPTRRTYAATKKGDTLKYVVTYITNCTDMREEIHPAVRDFLFSLGASKQTDSHVVAALAPIYVSPPALMPQKPTEKIHFLGWTSDGAHNSYELCHEQGATVRALIQLRGGDHIHTHVETLIKNGNPPSLLAIMKFGKQLIKLLRKLHFLGIIHGSVQAENIQFLHHKEDGYQLGEDHITLTDYSEARFEPTFHGKSEMYDETVNKVYAMMSPYQIMGRRSTSRDDLYRAMEVIADIMTGQKLFKALNESEVTFREGLMVKLQGQLFSPGMTIKHRAKKDGTEKDVTLWESPYGKVPEATARSIAVKLNNAMVDKILELKIDDDPSYDEIIAVFDSVIAQLES